MYTYIYIYISREVLVLGAWGCGAFGGDPAMMANLFGQAATNKHMRGLTINKHETTIHNKQVLCVSKTPKQPKPTISKNSKTNVMIDMHKVTRTHYDVSIYNFVNYKLDKYTTLKPMK